MSKIGLHSLQGALIGGCAAVAVLAALYAGTLDRLEYLTYDWRVNLRAKPSAYTDHIHIIAIDQTALNLIERDYHVPWPWPRQLYEPIIAFCRRAGVRALIFDMLYTEISATGDAHDDRIFGAAIAAGPPIVMALPLSHTQGLATNWAASPVSPVGYPQIDRVDARLAQRLPHARRTAFPIPAIATNATLLGSVMAEPDRDSLFRRIPLFTAFDGRVVPSLGAAAYAASHEGVGALAAQVSEARVVDARAGVVLRFRGPSQSHPFHSARTIIESELRLREGLAPQVHPDSLKGRYVLLGATAPGLHDLKPTPVGAGYPGVELHATLLDNLLAGDSIRDVAMPITVTAMLLLSILTGMGGRLSPKPWMSGLLLTGTAGLPFAAGIAAYDAGFWLPVAPLAATGAMTALATIIVNYAVEGRQKRFIKNAFRQYLSPAVIDRLVLDPGQLSLGGETRELSILFSDVQGFTRIAETLSPADLTTLLNTYLTAMTDIILDEGGTIDKYEGDAIIAFWNAPLSQPDHPLRAVRAALRCRQRLAAMQPEFTQRYGHGLTARIGINSGTVVVGNMGSNQRFDYTFLGDAGNLASRLEGVNKSFGTTIIISETTRAAIGDAFPVRELATVQVVGKQHAVRIFEPFLPADAGPRKSILDTFAQGLAAWYRGEIATASRLFAAIEADDPPAAAYCQRIANLPASRPDSWSGTWTMTEK